MTREANVPTQEDLEYLKQTPSAFVRDAVNRLRIGGCVMNGPVPVRPFGFGNRHVAGPVRTMQLLPRRGTGLKTYNVYSEVIPSSEPGEVLVIAGNGLPGWAAGENQINAFHIGFYHVIDMDQVTAIQRAADTHLLAGQQLSDGARDQETFRLPGSIGQGQPCGNGKKRQSRLRHLQIMRPGQE